MPVFQLQTPLERVFEVVDRVLEQHPGLVEKLELNVSDVQIGSQTTDGFAGDAFVA